MPMIQENYAEIIFDMDIINIWRGEKSGDVEKSGHSRLC